MSKLPKTPKIEWSTSIESWYRVTWRNLYGRTDSAVYPGDMCESQVRYLRNIGITDMEVTVEEVKAWHREAA
jgi:hypothetical protein